MPENVTDSESKYMATKCLYYKNTRGNIISGVSEYCKLAAVFVIYFYHRQWLSCLFFESIDGEHRKTPLRLSDL